MMFPANRQAALPSPFVTSLAMPSIILVEQNIVTILFLLPCHLDEMNDYIEINKKGGALLYIIIGDTCSKNKTPGM